MKIVYVAGWGRSGSTVLGNVLAQGTGLLHLGEVRQIWERGFLENRSCGCGAPFHECPFWTDVTREAWGGPQGIDAAAMAATMRRYVRDRNLPAMIGRSGIERTRRRLGPALDHLARLYAAIGAVGGTSTIVDSSKAPAYGWVVAHLPGVTMPVVHLVRDPRAVAFSWQRTRVHEAREGRSFLMKRHSAAGSSWRWSLRSAEVELLWRRGEAGYALVRYEDFVQDPAAVVRTIFAACDVDAPPPPIAEDGSIHLEGNHSVYGNPSRFGSGVVRLRADDEWRQKMSARQRFVVYMATAPWALRYGYLGSAT